MTAGKDHVVSGLIEKRRELSAVIDQLQRQLDQYRVDLTHIDGVLRVLASDLDPETIRPKRLYRRNRYFARNELSLLCLGVLRTAASEPLSTDEMRAGSSQPRASMLQTASCAPQFANRSDRSSNGYTATAQSRTLAQGGPSGS
jgi:hypothetical protein